MALRVGRGVGWFAFLVVAASRALAADLPEAAVPAAIVPAAYAPAPVVPDWIVTIGGELRVIPAWPGAPEGKFAFVGGPLFSVRKEGTPADYFGPRDSFGFSVLDLGQIKLGPAVKIIWPRQESSYAALNGLGNVDLAVQVGAFAE